MEKKEVIKILKYHNSWRRGEKKHMRFSPTKIGIAIDKAIFFLDKNNYNHDYLTNLPLIDLTELRKDTAKLVSEIDKALKYFQKNDIKNVDS